MISPFYQKHKINIRIHIFKTNIETNTDVNFIKILLNSDPKINQWSIDLEDIDRVLRIEANKSLNKQDIIDKIKSKGFICRELE